MRADLQIYAETKDKGQLRIVFDAIINNIESYEINKLSCIPYNLQEKFLYLIGQKESYFFELLKLLNENKNDIKIVKNFIDEDELKTLLGLEEKFINNGLEPIYFSDENKIELNELYG